MSESDTDRTAEEVIADVVAGHEPDYAENIAKSILTALREEGWKIVQGGRNVWQCEDEDEMAVCVDEEDRNDRRAVHGGHRFCGWRLQLPVEAP